MQIEFLPVPMPDHLRLPVRLYRGVLDEGGEPLDAAGFEARFIAHGWCPQWRSGLYRQQHYHANAHEALGVFAGQALLQLGGPEGVELRVGPDDALLVPAGTPHRSLQATRDFCAVGAYPPGQRWDLHLDVPGVDVRAVIAAVPDPACDPITGQAFAAVPGT